MSDDANEVYDTAGKEIVQKRTVSRYEDLNSFYTHPKHNAAHVYCGMSAKSSNSFKTLY